MNNAKSTPEERLLDAALTQVLRERPQVRAQSSRSVLVAAAMVVLGVSVVGTLLWQGRLGEAVSCATAQDAVREAIPQPVRARGLAEVKALPVDTVSLSVWLQRPAELVALERFKALRRLDLHGYSPIATFLGSRPSEAGAPWIWTEPPAEIFAPLAKLPALEELNLSSAVGLRPEWLRGLRTSTSLRLLGFSREQFEISEAWIAEMGELPALKTLKLFDVTVDVTVMRRLARLELHELQLEHCFGIDAAAFAVLCDMTRLQRLSIQGLGTRSLRKPNGFTWKPTPEDIAKLDALTGLRALELRGSTLGDAQLRALPDRLESLALHGVRGVGPVGVASLRRLGSLRHLALRRSGGAALFAKPPDQEGVADELARVLGTLRLSSLELSGVVTDALADAIASQPDLVRLDLSPRRVPDLETIALSASLRRLRIVNIHVQPLAVEDLEPLKKCRPLRELELFYFDDLRVADVEKLLGEQVAVSVVRARAK